MSKFSINAYKVYSIVAVHGLAGKDFDTWSPKSAPPLSSLLSTMVYRGSDYRVDINTMDFQYEVRDAFTRTNGITGFRKLAFDLLEEVYTILASLFRCTDASRLICSG